MGIIRIFANGIELDYVRESLRIKKESNAFITDFKASHSSFPFLIVENATTKRALGTRDITSVLKVTVVPVTVLEKGDKYYGELQVINYLNGYRKCNLKYGSDLLKILGKKLSALLPVVSVIPGETDPVPYSEEGIEVVPGFEHWNDYPLPFSGKIFPEVNYQFPELAWKHKFWEEEPEEGDEWRWYYGFYNRVHPDPLFFEANTYDIYGETGQEISIFNRNVPSPQLYLLGILKLAFASAGWKIAGAFTETEFIKRLLVLSTKSNLCAVPIVPETQMLTFADFPHELLFVYHYYQYDFVPDAPGNYEFHYHVKESLYPGGITVQNHKTLLVWKSGSGTVFDENTVSVYRNTNDPDVRVFDGSFTISVSEDQVGDTFKIQWCRHNSVSGFPLEFDIRWGNEAKTFQMMHPTIPLGRYAPDWSLSDYINEIKKLFCLDIRFDDLTKTAWFDYTATLLKSSKIYQARKSLALSDYAPPAYNAIMLQYGNDHDNMLYIDRNGPQMNRREEGDLVLDLQSKFKLVPHNSYTSDISASEDKDGVGLMIYDPGDYEAYRIPVTAPDYDGQTLSIDGALGIYNIFWKHTIQFRLNASAVEIEGPFTETEISKMLAAQKLWIDNQTYVITILEYSETLQGNYEVKLKLESVTL